MIAEPAAKPRAKVAKKKPQGRTGKSIQMYLPGELLDALDAYVEATRPRPTKTAIFEMMLEDFLTKAGYWPRPAGDDVEG